MERKLTAILCADVFGYSRLMGENEEATLRTLSSHRKLIDSLIEQHHGRFVNSAGDSVLAEFASVVNAVQCAVEIQSTLKAENAPLSPDRRMEFRIGVNLGDVMVDGEQIYGDGVNVAARLESLADPGGICISAIVYDQIKNKLALNYKDLGAQQVKNIAEPVRVFQVLPEGEAASIRKTARVQRKYVRRGIFSMVGLTLIAALIVFAQHLSLRPPTPSASIPPAQPPALALPDKPSIAVLPFANMSGDRDQEYFSDGITDDLITSLSRLPNLFVIARISTFTYKGKAAMVQDIGRELGVAYVLEGSVRKADNQVRITAQLVDTTTGDHIWAESYDRPLRDIFLLQDEIVQRIVTTLSLQLTLEGRAIQFKKRTHNFKAYDDFLRALEYMLSTTKDGDEKAHQLLDKAITLDPEYSDAYAELAWVYFMDGLLEVDLNFVNEMFQAAQKAISLDDSNAFAYVVLSNAYMFLTRARHGKRLDSTSDYDQSLSAAERAITIDPNFAPGYSALAYVLESSGRSAESLALIKKALRLDPNNHGWPPYLLIEALAYTYMGRYEEAIPVYKEHLVHHPNDVIAHEWLAASYVGVGRLGDARAEAAEVMRISPSFSLETQKRFSIVKKGPMLDRNYAYMVQAGLK